MNYESGEEWGGNMLTSAHVSQGVGALFTDISGEMFLSGDEQLAILTGGRPLQNGVGDFNPGRWVKKIRDINSHAVDARRKATKNYSNKMRHLKFRKPKPGYATILGLEGLDGEDMLLGDEFGRVFWTKKRKARKRVHSYDGMGTAEILGSDYGHSDNISEDVIGYMEGMGYELYEDGMGKSWFKKMASKVGGAVKAVAKGTVNVVKKAPKAVFNATKAVVRAPIRAAQAITSGVKKEARGMAKAIGTEFKYAKKGAQAVKGALATEGKYLGKGVANTVQSVANIPLDAAKFVGKQASGIAKSTVGAAKSVSSSAVDVAEAGGEVAYHYAKTVVGAPVRGAGKLLSKIGDDAAALFSSKKKGGGGGGDAAPQQGEAGVEAAAVDAAAAQAAAETAALPATYDPNAGAMTPEQRMAYEQNNPQPPAAETYESASEFDEASQDVTSYPENAQVVTNYAQQQSPGQAYMPSGQAVASYPAIVDSRPRVQAAPIDIVDAEATAGDEGNVLMSAGNYEANSAFQPAPLYEETTEESNTQLDMEGLGSLVADEIKQNQRATYYVLNKMANTVYPDEKMRLAQQKLELDRRAAELAAARAALIAANGGIDPLKKPPVPKPMPPPKKNPGYAQTAYTLIPTNSEFWPEVDSEHYRTNGAMGFFGDARSELTSLAAGAMAKEVGKNVLDNPALRASLEEMAKKAGDKATESARKEISKLYTENKTKIFAAGGIGAGLLLLLTFALLKPRTIKVSAKELNEKGMVYA